MKGNKIMMQLLNNFYLNYIVFYISTIYIKKKGK